MPNAASTQRNLTTKTVGPREADSHRKARQAAAKVQANADRVAELNQAAEPGALSRQACIAYLQAHGAYSGHSRDTVEQLRQVVAEHKAKRTASAQNAAQLAAERNGLAPAAKPTKRDAKAEAAEAARKAEAEAQARAVEVLAGSIEAHPDADPNPVRRLELAKTEHKALQAWIKDGENPPRPATPNLDAVNSEYAAGVTATTRKKVAKASAKGSAAATRTKRGARYAEAMAAKKAKQRPEAKRLDDAELAAYIGRIKAEHGADADPREWLEVAYWLDGLAISRGRWTAAWEGAQATAAA